MCQFCLNEDMTDGRFTLSKKEADKINNSLNVQGAVDDAINQLYNDGTITTKTKKELFKSHYEPLKMAVNEGFGGAKIEYGTPNYEFLKQLQTNTAVFSIFKSHASQKEMAALLKDQSGNRREKQDFIIEAKKVDATYRTRYLDVEYDTATRTARMASQWAKFEKNKRLYPNLKYILTKAAKPDEKHLQYVGIIRPVGDSFWNAHYPPNRWRCQCGVESTDAEATDVPANLPPVPAEFAFNAGKTGQIFDLKNSEYIKSVPAKDQPKLIKEATKEVNAGAAAAISFQPVYESKSGTAIEVHPLAFDNADYQKSFNAAKDLANSKLPVKKIEILPTITDPVLRQQIMPYVKGSKNPDYRIDDVVHDLKEPSGTKQGKRTIKNLLADAVEQGAGAVLIVPENYTADETLYRNINGQFQQPKYKDFSLFLKYENQWSHYNQDGWVKFFEKEKLKYRGKNS